MSFKFQTIDDVHHIHFIKTSFRVKFIACVFRKEILLHNIIICIFIFMQTPLENFKYFVKMMNALVKMFIRRCVSELRIKTIQSMNEDDKVSRCQV